MAPPKTLLANSKPSRGAVAPCESSVAELAVAAGLLFVASRRSTFADGLAVGHLGGLEVDLGW